jgi:hypothetical protein
MSALRKYRRIEKTRVVAVRLDLETEGFTYEKWGGTQQCKAGDWVVLNAGETYTVDGETFARTYEQVSDGVYEKTAPVWAEQAGEAGRIGTREGSTGYEAGWFLVYNDPNRRDGYAMAEEKFRSLYEPADGD